VSVLLDDVTVVDIGARRTRPRQSVLIEGGRITALSNATTRLSQGPEAEVISCGGKFLLPGLVDVHVHLRPEPQHHHQPQPNQRDGSATDAALASLHSYLYCGVTSVFDAGNDGNFIWPLRDAERSGAMVSPRIFCAGPFVTCTDGHGSKLCETVTVDELPKDLPALLAHFEHRPDLVKVTLEDDGFADFELIPIMELGVLGRVVDLAHESGLRVAVHTSNELRSREAVACGADVLAHPVVQSPMTDGFVKTLVDGRVPVASTLAFAERYVRLADDPGYLDEDVFTACIDSIERDRLRTVEHERQGHSRWAKWLRVMLPVIQQNLRTVVQAGGTIATGTDLDLGPYLLWELMLLQDAGIEPWDVLACATLNAARFLGRESEMGAVAPGKVADLVLVDRDPTTDVSRLSDIVMVMKGGQIVDRSSLRLAGERPTRTL
jgi:imidazolonepropionase-like amidohydrolase